MNPAISALLVVAALSGVGGWLWCRAKPVERPVKVMMFVGYFWLLAFAQLLLIALAYLAWRHLLNP